MRAGGPEGGDNFGVGGEGCWEATGEGDGPASVRKPRGAGERDGWPLSIKALIADRRAVLHKTRAATPAFLLICLPVSARPPDFHLCEAWLFST